ncbi:MAG: hypothetical protein K0Q74_538 [Gammaproteobacteria bacterium]|nr:hypothetical protein [Gammaproteobacteria bacterium]
MIRMLSKMIKPDARGRVLLGRLTEGVSSFSVTVDADNRIILEPYTEIPVREKWLFDNKNALKKVKNGIKDSALGRVSERGSFIKYIDDDTE